MIGLWNDKLKLQKGAKLTSESCSARALWVTSFVPLTGINKIAVAFTSKEIGEDFCC